MTRSRNMGVNVGEDDLEKFDILKDLETTRANLNERLINEEDKGEKRMRKVSPYRK